MFTATGYYDTGFDIINVPDTQSLLRNCARTYQTFPALDILNKRFLSSIKIKINPALGEKDLDGLDYIELKEDGDQSGIFYYVTSYSLTSRDVAVLNVVQDSFLTAGGTQGVNGAIVVKRSHIAKADDYFGAYCEDDELLCPNEPLLMVYGGATTNIKDSDNVKMGEHRPAIGQFFCFGTDTSGGTAFSPNTVVCSTVGFNWLDGPVNRHDILDGTHMYKFDTAEDGTWGTETVSIVTDGAHVYPEIPKAAGADVYLTDPYVKINRSSENVSWDATQWPPYKGIGYDGIEYHNLDQYSAESLAALRMVGMEDAIISCYRLNPGEGKCTNGSIGASPSKSRLQGQEWLLKTNDRNNNGGDYRIAGSSYYDYDYLGNLYSANEGGQVHNERILYGKFRKYVISSPATGSTAEALPEELTAKRFKTGWNSTAGASNVGWQDAPTIAYFSDPRPTGRPYYNFVKIGQRVSIYEQSVTQFYMSLTEGAIAGGQWPEVPIVFTGMAGEFQARVGYELSASYSDYLASPERTYRNLVSGSQMANYQTKNNALESMGLNALKSAGMGAAGGFVTGGAPGAVVGALGGVVTTDINTSMAVRNADISYNVQLDAANRDMLLGASGNYNEALQGNVTANAQIERMRARDYERAQFELSTMYQVPRAKFMATESMRDFTENCLFYARYTPTVNDLKRMDAILDAYGYKRNEEKDTTQLYAVRPNFVYIEGSFSKMQIPDGIVGKKDIMQDINAQFANGIRIWHRSPKNQGLYPGV